MKFTCVYVMPSGVECGKVNVTKYDHDHHGYTHLPYDERPYVCEQCGDKFCRPEGVTGHGKRKHPKVEDADDLAAQRKHEREAQAKRKEDKKDLKKLSHSDTDLALLIDEKFDEIEKRLEDRKKDAETILKQALYVGTKKDGSTSAAKKEIFDELRETVTQAGYTDISLNAFVARLYDDRSGKTRSLVALSKATLDHIKEYGRFNINEIMDLQDASKHAVNWVMYAYSEYISDYAGMEWEDLIRAGENYNRKYLRSKLA